MLHCCECALVLSFCIQVVHHAAYGMIVHAGPCVVGSISLTQEFCEARKQRHLQLAVSGILTVALTYVAMPDCKKRRPGFFRPCVSSQSNGISQRCVAPPHSCVELPDPRQDHMWVHSERQILKLSSHVSHLGQWQEGQHSSCAHAVCTTTDCILPYVRRLSSLYFWFKLAGKDHVGRKQVKKVETGEWILKGTYRRSITLYTCAITILHEQWDVLKCRDTHTHHKWQAISVPLLWFVYDSYMYISDFNSGLYLIAKAMKAERIRSYLWCGCVSAFQDTLTVHVLWWWHKCRVFCISVSELVSCVFSTIPICLLFTCSITSKLELKETYRNCRKSAESKLGYWYI